MLKLTAKPVVVYIVKLFDVAGPSLQASEELSSQVIISPSLIADVENELLPPFCSEPPLIYHS